MKSLKREEHMQALSSNTKIHKNRFEKIKLKIVYYQA